MLSNRNLRFLSIHSHTNLWPINLLFAAEKFRSKFVCRQWSKSRDEACEKCSSKKFEEKRKQFPPCVGVHKGGEKKRSTDSLGDGRDETERMLRGGKVVCIMWYERERNWKASRILSACARVEHLELNMSNIKCAKMLLVNCFSKCFIIAQTIKVHIRLVS